MKKKILFVVPLPPPTHGASFINNLIIKNHEINKNFDIFSFNSSQSKNYSELNSINLKKIFLFFFTYCRLIKKIFFVNPNLIFFNPSPRGVGFYRDIFYIILFKIFKKKIVFHLHGKGFKEKYKKSFIWKILLINLFKNINLICLSNKLIDDIKLFYDKNKKIYILNNFSFTPPKISKKNKIFTFIYLSNLIPDKGIMIFLDAINLMNKKYKNFNAKVIGNSRNINFLKKIKKKINLLPNVKYLGEMYGKKKYIELNNSNVFVLPTRNDAFPISILEAMSLKLPIISSRVGGIPDIVKHNKTGFLVKNINFKQYAKFMSIYLNKKKLAILHGRNAKNKHKNNYTKDIFEKKFIKILKKII